MKQKIVVIGTSTGGPTQIRELVKGIEKLNATVFILLHMRQEMLEFFSKELQNSAKVKVLTTPVATALIQHSIVIVTETSRVLQRGNLLEVFSDTDKQIYSPDINLFLHSLAEYCDQFSITVMIMTGMGEDGYLGCKLLKEKGATIIAQTQKGCPLYGMPKKIIDTGLADFEMTPQQMLEYIKAL